MVDIDNRVDRHEERRTEEKRTEERRQIEKKLQQEPMRTFEAKLSEKTAQELQGKESVAKHMHDLKKSKEDKQSLLDRILGVIKDKSQENEKSRVNAAHRQGKDEQRKETKKRIVEEDFKAKQTREDDKGSSQKTQKKEGEVSQEGHKRVAEKEEGDGGGGFGQGGGRDSQSGERSFDQGAQSKFGEDHKQAEQTKQDAVKGFVGQVREQSRFSSGGFQRGARNFTQQNLDEIVSAVQLGVNEKGEEEFSVELTDDYFEGLKIMATRTEQGVVVKFICPNVSVRSTFLKCRPQVYQQLRSKQIEVFRVDVV
ncbi:MAG: hypothetical protein ACD_62C00494G0003 [uncultured bacterium]|nr:MAG: hypothetical protein ACD_62C00494G0003 [uncultured bacterium]HLD46132.1 hypothetical protein [bacterium]